MARKLTRHAIVAFALAGTAMVAGSLPAHA